MDKLISITNTLLDAFTIMGGDAPLDLPAIAVVGSQSAGKSSVLENIVGRSFLPRGSGIVTRRPCVIQLHHTAPGSQEYGMFLHDSTEKKFYDFDEISKEIQAETDRVCGGNKNLSNIPINVRIFSPNVLDLTLIDLPGATRVPVADQPEDIGEQIERMIMSYIERPNCIILAVSAANADLANSDALVLSRKVDPDGERTLGVLTKLDLMDQGTDAYSIFTGTSDNMPILKLGYVGVINRSQADINSNKTIADARKQEMKYFTSHPKYAGIKDEMGTEHLVARCSRMLATAIKNNLPVISSELTTLIAAKQKELSLLPEDDPGKARARLVQMLVQFLERFRLLLKGNTDTRSDEYEGGSRLEAVFRHMYAEEVKSMQVLDDMTPNDVKTLIQNVKGLGGGFFTPDEVLLSLIRRQIERMEKPALKCSEKVNSELMTVVKQATEQIPGLDSFPEAASAINGTVAAIISSKFQATQEQLKYLVKMELHRVNFAHPDFIGRNGLADFMEQDEKNKNALQLEAPSPRNLQPGDNAQLPRKMVLTNKLAAGQTLSAEEEAELNLINSTRLRLGRSTHRASGSHSPATSPRHQRVDSSMSQEIDAKLRSINADMTPRERKEVDMLIRLSVSYFDIVKRTQLDIVPKAIQLLLVQHTKEQVNTDLMTHLTSDTKVKELMAISDAVRAKRKETEEALKLLQKAQSVLLHEVTSVMSSM